MTPDALADLWPAIERSAFGQAAKSGSLLYPIANVAHVVGACLLVGAIVVYDALLIGRRVEQARAIADVALPVAVVGLTFVLASAPVLFAAEASALAYNPAFLAKMALVTAAALNVAIFYMRGGDERPAALQAWLSASLWLAIVVAGRAIAYV